MAAQCPVKNESLGPGPVPNMGRHPYPKNLLSPLPLMALSRRVKDQLDTVIRQYLLTILQACAAFPVSTSQIVLEEVKPCCPPMRDEEGEVMNCWRSWCISAERMLSVLCLHFQHERVREE